MEQELQSEMAIFLENIYEKYTLYKLDNQHSYQVDLQSMCSGHSILNYRRSEVLVMCGAEEYRNQKNRKN